MKAIGKVIFAVAALALMVSGADAQMSGGGHKQQQKSAATTGTQKPKADEKAYNQAINSLPDKKADPWHDMR
jgi:hypothetical protein